MKPLRVSVRILGGAKLPDGVQLDAMLAYVVALRDGLPPPDPGVGGAVGIPIARSPCGRFHMVSAGLYVPEAHEVRHFHKRAPIEEIAYFGDGKTKTVNVAAGVNKSYRIPVSLTHVEDDTIAWFCIGDAEGIRDLVKFIDRIGGKRSMMAPRVKAWTIGFNGAESRRTQKVR